MSTNTVGSGTRTTIVPASDVSLSKWVNEKLPAWHEILSTHEVARLTRRHRWILATLTLLGRFPRPQRFRGRTIGWRRRDVERWLLDESESMARDQSSTSSSSAGDTPPRRGRARSITRRCSWTRVDRRPLCRRTRGRRRTRALHGGALLVSNEADVARPGQSMELPLTHEGTP